MSLKRITKELKDLDAESIAEITTKNAKKVFKI